MPTLSATLPHASALKTARDALVQAVPGHEDAWQHADAVAAIVQPLGVDDDIVVGALLFPLLAAGLIDVDRAAHLVGNTAAHIARDCVQLLTFGAAGRVAGKSLSAGQAETLRKMLLAIASDARLVFIRLAEQLYQLRNAKQADETERERLARETREIYAPLANRLGIWQLKWELEDLSFRYLDPDAYKRIAGWLASKRVDREQYLQQVQQELHAALEKAGIKAEIAGRPKHIYSIWRKMQRKGLSFDQIYDVRAVRILVDTITECYAALGIVHGLWPYIPGEFDDYIATPKDNLYRSLHTAVIGPGKLPLEVQIRTHEMHAHAELGVAAHWRYKEGGRSDPAYEQKIAWLRQILEPAEHGGESETDFLDRMREELFEDRVYALSPRGEVVDLPKGATPLDYAYHVHTELGHRCRGAKLNDQIVSLTAVINNGDKVEIITGKHANPSRDWLIPSLGYLASPRSRAKVRAWFRKQDEEQNRAQGKQLLERELHRLAIHSVTLPELIADFHFENADQLYLALGAGELTIPQITGAIQRRNKQQELIAPVINKIDAEKPAEGIRVQGVGELMSTYARCCRPVPPEIIGGYITQGRGISIHRRNCSNFLRLQDKHPERVIEVDWGHDADQVYPVDIVVTAYDRRGLVRDVSAVLADAKVSIQSMNTVTQKDGMVDMQLRVAIHNLQELSHIIGKIQGQANVISVRRQR
ncbi:MAG TPA: bifunctional (p)ppGpp synthetase/guanosine-3',5'-bis(diphosphate) 3'-pyrophosphohydrolase [Steroidobacteraceae bacterium]|nr:bifunctional (p)ppGpp synthetase/guanosine-3',5'-bis(diphosphate) 3'-pyrophosphohydrolase [Steroidobacteraceae bacterium]